MNENDAKTAFRSLVETLRSKELGWLVDEALAEIRRGKPKEKKVRVSDSSVLVLVSEESAEGSSRGSATFVESVEYTPQEQLEILISALERGVVAPIMMEGEVAEVLSKAVKQESPIQLRFLGEGDGGETREYSEGGRSERRAVGETLLGLVTRCREVIRASD